MPASDLEIVQVGEHVSRYLFSVPSPDLTGSALDKARTQHTNDYERVRRHVKLVMEKSGLVASDTAVRLMAGKVIRLGREAQANYFAAIDALGLECKNPNI